MLDSTSQIIVDVSAPTERRPYYAVHLHDRVDSLIVDSTRKVVLIQQGPGPGRQNQLAFAMNEILRFSAEPVSLGHNLVDEPVKDQHLERRRLAANQLFFPVLVLLHVDFRGPKGPLTIEVGTTATPILCREIANTEFPEHIIAPNTPDRTVHLADRTLAWVAEVNHELEIAARAAASSEYDQLLNSILELFDHRHRSRKDIEELIAVALETRDVKDLGERLQKARPGQLDACRRTVNAVRTLMNEPKVVEFSRADTEELSDDASLGNPYLEGGILAMPKKKQRAL